MKPIIVTATRSIHINAYRATRDQAKLVDLARDSYGHLLRHKGPATYSFGEFADIIAQSYDVRENQQNKVVFNTLKDVQAMAVTSVPCST